MSNNSSLKTISALTLAALLFFSMYYMHSIKISLTQESTSYFIELLDKTSKLIKIKTETNFQILKTISKEATKLDELSDLQKVAFLKDKSTNSPFTTLAYADKNGFALLDSGELTDIKLTNFYQLSLYKQKSCLESLNDNLIFSIPVHNADNQVIGVLYALTPIEDFFKNSTASLLHINNSNTYIINNTTLNTHFLTSDNDLTLIEKAKLNPVEHIIPLFKNSNISLTEFYASHAKYIFANTRIQDEEQGLNWSLITIVPSSVLSTAATQTIALISLLLFLLLLVFISTIAYILNMQTQNKTSLEKIAYIDNLCAIYNNNGLILYGEKKLKLWQINVAVVYLDIDNFKMINNVFGYEYGDQLLKNFSINLKKFFRAHSISARLSMDHFAIIVHYSNKLLFFKNLNKFITTTKKLYLHKHILKISAGIYFPADHTDEGITDMLTKANIARQKVKNKDRLPYFVYNDKLEQDLYYKTWLLAELKAALKAKSLELFYQPQYNLKTFKINSAEAILVWQHADKGFIPQNIFLKIAEDNQLRTQLTNLMLEKICIDMALCQSQKIKPRKISLNLSKFDFYQDNLVEIFTKLIKKYDLAYSLFEIEIEENILVNNYAKIEPHLAKFRNLGITIAIDNFGTGYSSFSTLGTLAVDAIKIDHSIIVNSINKDKHLNIIKSIITLAQSIDLTTIADGIETQEQLDTLVALNCDFAQGYILAKAIPIENYLQLLKYINGD